MIVNWFWKIFGLDRKRKKRKCTKHLIEPMREKKSKVMKETLEYLGSQVQKKKQVA